MVSPESRKATKTGTSRITPTARPECDPDPVVRTPRARDGLPEGGGDSATLMDVAPSRIFGTVGEKLRNAIKEATSRIMAPNPKDTLP